EHLVPMGRWITPAFSPIRFEAQYFAAVIPEEEAPNVWPGENTDGAWWGVQAAQDAHAAGDLFISYPVLETLKVISDCDEDIEAAARVLEARNGNHDPDSGGGGEMLAGVRLRPVLTPTLPPAKHTNVYVLGRGELIVIDPATPLPDEQRDLIAYLEGLERQGERLREIWLTHHHPDHVGAVDAVRERFQIPVAAHRLCAEDLERKVKVDRFIEDGELTVFNGPAGIQDRWRALHTPGHARGHLCFYEERAGTLVSGDLVVSIGTVVIAAPDGDMTDYFESLRRVRSLPKHGFLLPAHGHPLATTAAKIDEYIAHRSARESSVYDSLDEAKSPLEIVPELYADVPKQLWPLAAASVESHLVKLERDGRVQKDGERWVRA
ncbi:MAG: MBL fold metallo-hydrolase, partial [Myxococcota bacterium]